jgi:hypothetical protein
LPACNPCRELPVVRIYSDPRRTCQPATPDESSIRYRHFWNLSAVDPKLFIWIRIEIRFCSVSGSPTCTTFRIHNTAWQPIVPVGFSLSCRLSEFFFRSLQSLSATPVERSASHHCSVTIVSNLDPSDGSSFADPGCFIPDPNSFLAPRIRNRYQYRY